ncbi:MAG: uncharacterized protein JWN48_71 [Myxococcaceae bacterium]|nr:uncharacterized protein [Myxococcaceae bacterium]
MLWRSVGLLLVASCTYACGSDDGASELPNALPFGSPGASDDAGGDAGTRHDLDASSKPSTRADATMVWLEDPLNADSACAAASVSAEQVVVQEQVQVEVEVQVPAPVALYIMMDKSLSMQTSGIWTPAVEAMTKFVHDPGSAGIDVALQYFPGGGQCNGSGYSTPAVALGTLPGNANALANSLAGQSANGFGTPIEGALRGVTGYCKAFQAAHPLEKCIAVLVTDGKPELDGCNDNAAQLAAIAGTAWTQDKVRTFAVGLQGADFGLLDNIAKLGGAKDCDPTSARYACDVSGGTDKLSTALATIRDTVATTMPQTVLQTQVKERPLECEWQMPVPAAGVAVDKDRVNVTLSGGSAAQLSLGRVADAASCQAGAWYFDAPAAPTRIIACPATCDTIKASGYTAVNILLGCETHLLLL